MRVFQELARANGNDIYDQQDIVDQVLKQGKYKRALETQASLGNGFRRIYEAFNWLNFTM